jgi:hypothetical protein
MAFNKQSSHQNSMHIPGFNQKGSISNVKTLAYIYEQSYKGPKLSFMSKGYHLMYKSIVSICLISILQLSATISHAAENNLKIIFDEAHGQLFSIDDTGDLKLSKLAETMRASGAQVNKTSDILSDDTLKGATGLVISGLFKPLQNDEIEALVRFMQKGGRVAVMMHISPPLANLIFRLGLGYSQTVIHERQNVIDKDINFRITDLSPNPLFTGIDSFSAYGVWAVDPRDKSTSIARTSPKAWMDFDNTGIISDKSLVGTFTIVAIGALGSGQFAIFGDDAIFQNRFLEGNNQKLAENLARWLTAR